MKRLDINEKQIDMENLTPEERDDLLRSQADTILEGIIAAAENVAEETQDVTIERAGRKFFKLTIRPVSDKKSKELRKKCTVYSKNKTYGVRLPEDTDMTKYRSMLIYEATVNKDETWDNKLLWKALESRYPIVTGWQTVDCVLLAGEKDRLMDAINALSGYQDEDELEETVKNSSEPEVSPL